MRGQKPELVIVGNDPTWANRNRFCFVDIRDLGEDLIAFAGLLVNVRMANPFRFREALQRLALNADLVVVCEPGTRSEIL